MSERAGYRTLLGRIRDNARAYIGKQLALPRQEIAEIVKANLQAAKWFGLALLFGFLFLIALTIFLIALVAIFLPLWASALLVMLLLATGAGFAGWTGYRRLVLRGPTRSIESVKETIRWAKARLLGRNAS